MYIKRLGKILKNERKEWGMSRYKLAKLIGEEKEVIEDIELGREKNPNFYLMLKICNILDISIFSLLTQDGNEKFFNIDMKG